MDYTLLEYENEFERVLKKYSTYRNTPIIWEGCFCYTKTDKFKLIDLKDKYKLDKFRLENDVDTVRNIMRWVYEIVLFPDISDYNGDRYGIDIADFCRENRTTVNCAMHSILFTDALLSLGFKTRSIQCLPLDPLDNDSHFINIVYIESKGKWVAYDSSFSVCYTDKLGRQLNLKELRESIIENRAFTVNRYTRFKDSKEFNYAWYRSYISKNLFRFSCTQDLNFNSEENVIYILCPDGYGEINTERTINGLTIRYTDNSKFFWEE